MNIIYKKGFSALSIIIILTVLILGAVYLYNKSSQREIVSLTSDQTQILNDEVSSSGASGLYTSYSEEKLALAEEGKVVLFFRAPWCPTCRALDANIRSNLAKIPEGVTILDVDYDSSTALKQKYKVTYQHTLVQVDKEGNQVARWSSSMTLEELISQLQ